MAISLGSINFGIGPDTSRLQAAIRQVQNFGQAVENAAAATGRGARQTEAALRRQEKAAIEALSKTAELNRALKNANAPTNMFRDTERAINTLVARLTNGQRSALDYQRAMELWRTSMNTTTRDLKNHVRETMEAGKGQSRFATILRDAASAAVIYSGPLGGLATRFSTMAVVVERASASTAAFLAGIGGGTLVFIAMAKAALDIARVTDKISKGLTSVSGSAIIAATDMKRLMETSDRLGVAFRDMANPYTSFMAAAKGTNLEGERADKIFKQYVASAKALGRTNEDITGGLRAMEQMISKGVVQAEELRGQFGDRFPGAMKAAADSMGVTTQKLGEMMKKGQITAGELLPKMMEHIAKTFNVDINKPIDDIEAAENRVRNALDRMGSTFDKTFGFSDAYKNALNGIASGMNYIAVNANNLKAVLGAAAGAMLGIVAPKILAGFSTFIELVRKATITMMAFNAASMANPFGALAGILVRVGLAVAGAAAGFKLLEDASTSSASAIAGGLPEVDSYIKAQGQLKTSIRETTLEYIKQVQVMQQQRKSALLTAAMEANQMSIALEKNMQGYSPKQQEVLRKSMGAQVDIAKGKVEEIRQQFLQGEEQLKALEDILKRQDAEEKKIGERVTGEGGGGGSKKGENRRLKALREAMQDIKKTEEQFRALEEGGTKALDKLNRELEITESISAFKDRLVDAGVSAAEATKLTDRYAVAIRGLKEGMYGAKDIVTGAEMLEDAFASFGNGAVDAFVDAVMEGKDVMQELGNVAKSVLADITKEFLKLALVNPLKNMLFNSNAPTFDFGALLGIGQAAKGMASTPGGFRFATGGVLHSPQMLATKRGPTLAGEAGPEAIMPLRRGRGGRLGVDASGAFGDPSSGPNLSVQVINQNGSNVSVKQGRGLNEGKIKIMIRDAMLEDLATNGEFTRSMQGMYRLNRMGGKR